MKPSFIQKAMAAQLTLLFNEVRELGLNVSEVGLEVGRKGKMVVRILWFDKQYKLNADTFATVVDALEWVEKRKGPLWRKFSL